MSELLQKARDIKRLHQERWMQIKGVLSVGIAEDSGKPVIIVSVESDPGLLVNLIPSTLDGVRIIIRQTGQISARNGQNDSSH